jgi:UDP-GlcNAc:undecaprenyl-phosphate/decaprenyl-phosphate GlcNAc-1-phosphate transferase
LTVAAIVVVAVSLVMNPVLALLRRLDVLDRPGERSSHRTATLRGGGIGPAVVACLVLAVTGGPERWGVLIAMVGFALLGALEDLRGLSPARRLVAQAVIAGVVTAVLFGGTGLRAATAVAAASAVLWIVAYVNAFNFMDGINGISVAQATIAGLAYAVGGVALDVEVLAVGGAVCAGAAVGFAPWNVPAARVFLGDSGSYFFGGMLAALALAGLLDAGVTPELVVAPLAVYLADTGVTLLRRLRDRETLTRPHRSHVYQQLTDCGFSHVQVAGFAGCVAAVCAALGAVSLADAAVYRIGADLAIVALLVMYLLSPGIVSRRRSAGGFAAV